MGIWKNAGGGYRSGGTPYQEYVRRMKGRVPLTEAAYTEQYLAGHPQDVQLVRLVERNELLAALNSRYAQQFFDEDVDAILETLVALTPDGKDKKAWARIHSGS